MSGGRRQDQVVVFAGLAVERVIERDSDGARVDDRDISGEQYGIMERDSSRGGCDVGFHFGRTGGVCREAFDGT